MVKLHARIGETEAPERGVRAWLFKYEAHFALLVRVFLAVLFIYSAWHKIADPFSFQLKVHEYQFPLFSKMEFVNWGSDSEFHPEQLVAPVSHVLPWVMVISGVLLITGFLSRAGALLQILMLLLFTAAIEINIYREVVLMCGCFSKEGHAIGYGLVARNLFLLLLAGYILDRGPGRFSSDHLLLGILRRRRDRKNEKNGEL